MQRTHKTMIILLVLCGVQASARAGDYETITQQNKADRSIQAKEYRRTPYRKRAIFYKKLEKTLLQRVDRLTAAWLGTRWGLGMPQTLKPGPGKVNCGLFVALVLKHSGFNLPIWKFNRQAAVHAIRSLAPRQKLLYFSNAPMKEFLKKVKRLGPGLYIIGLDFHIGFLRLKNDGKLRFVHASYITKKVVDEPAATAEPIVTSKYRVVGKVLQPNMLRWWLANSRIKVLGKR